MRPISRGRWRRCVNWRRAAAIVLPVWAGVGGVVGWHASTAAQTPPPTVAVAPPVVENQLEPPTAGAPFGPMLWGQLASAAATGATADKRVSPTHPFFPQPTPVWAAAVDAQVRAAKTASERAKLAGLPVTEQLAAAEEAKPDGPPKMIDGCRTFDTFVPWQASPRVAFRAAEREGKLVFLLHLSGEIDDDGFT